MCDLPPGALRDAGERTTLHALGVIGVASGSSRSCARLQQMQPDPDHVVAQIAHELARRLKWSLLSKKRVTLELKAKKRKRKEALDMKIQQLYGDELSTSGFKWVPVVKVRKKWNICACILDARLPCI